MCVCVYVLILVKSAIHNNETKLKSNIIRNVCVYVDFNHQ